MINFPLAFLLGLLGSVHCAVMCGPLMLSMPLSEQRYLSAAVQLLLYQLGRILIYVVLGVMVGLIGNSITLFTSQETLSLFVGSLLVFFTILHLSGRYFKFYNRFRFDLITPLSKMMAKVYGLPFWGFFAGMLNGLIPCGMVYLALTTALNSTSVKESANFMLLFGLGTTPLMLVVSLGKIYLKRYLSFNSNKFIPWLTLFIGTLFILRAAELGIPFFSPDHHINLKKHTIECR